MIRSRAEAMRLLRTVANLHPLQIAMRLPHLAVARSLAFMPGALAPPARASFPPPPRGLAAIAEAERARGASRLSHLPEGSRLGAYEATYGLELGASGEPNASAWHARVAIEPYPASVRARRLAVAIRLGHPGHAGHAGRASFAAELARACRAVMLQPELHLLGNHLLENGFALACGGAVTRGPEAEAWFRVGAAILDWQLPEQFLSDGGHFERTASYHVALTHALLETIELTRASGREVPGPWQRIARRALTWISEVRTPDGTYPLFNDAALDAAPALDDVHALGVALDLADAPSGGGRDRDARAVHLPQTGWVMLRGADATLAFDAGADGARVQPGHVHADALTIELWVGGERVIVDYGVASYANDEARALSRATRAHNTVEVEGYDSSEVWGAFRVGRRARASLHELREGRDSQEGGGREVLLAEASHDGYAFLPGGPVHARRVELRAGELRVSDHLTRSIPSGRGRIRAREQEPLVVVGRMRTDADARARRRVVVANEWGPLTTHASAWFPEHGASRPAEVFEQHGFLSERLVQTWSFRW